MKTLDSLNNDKLKRLLIDFRENAIDESWSSAKGKNDDIINGFKKARDNAVDRLVKYLNQLI